MVVVRRMTVVVIAALAGAAGCHRTFKGTAVQPNPLRQPLETLRVSEPIVVITHDMELNVPRPITGPPPNGRPGTSYLRTEPYDLRNIASFTVVSRDRLRFHVQLEHKWQEYADLAEWQAWILDSRGRRWLPEQIESRKPKVVVEMWDYEVQSVQRNSFGDIVAVNEDGYRNRQPLGSLALFRGQGDYVFHGQDIFTPDLRWIMLVVERNGMAFTFTWKFADEATSPGPRAASTLPERRVMR